MFLEVLRWGNRYKLAILEKNGRYFHWFIDRYFKEAPFLRLNLELLPWYFYFPILNSDGFREQPFLLFLDFVQELLPNYCGVVKTPEFLHKKLHFLWKRGL